MHQLAIKTPTTRVKPQPAWGDLNRIPPNLSTKILFASAEAITAPPGSQGRREQLWGEIGARPCAWLTGVYIRGNGCPRATLCRRKAPPQDLTRICHRQHGQRLCSGIIDDVYRSGATMAGAAAGGKKKPESRKSSH